MKGLKVKCPNCTMICFETTEQFNPDARPHGGMVKCLLPYQIDWLCSSTTLASEMCCPECLAPLVVGNVLNVVMPAREAGESFKKDVPNSKCNECGFNFTYIANQEGKCPKCGAYNITILNYSIPEDDFSNLKQSPPLDPKNFKFVCDVCGKECKSELGLKSHKRSHK